MAATLSWSVTVTEGTAGSDAAASSAMSGSSAVCSAATFSARSTFGKPSYTLMPATEAAISFPKRASMSAICRVASRTR